MGLRLPLYPFYVGRGPEEERRNRQGPDNARIEARLRELEDYFARGDVKRAAVNVIPPKGQVDVLNAEWVRPVGFEPDYESLSGLAQLVKRVRQDGGTIVIPNITHIIGRKDNGERPSNAVKDLMEKIYVEDIEILPLAYKLDERVSDSYEGRRPDRYKVIQYDLYKTYIKPRCADESLFRLAPRMARAAVEFLNRHVGCGER